MPTTIKTTVYQFDELSDSAKETARDWYREGGFYDWWDPNFEDFERVCEILGVHLSIHEVTLYGGGKRQESNIYFSGFWSQGDGASFEGWYSYAKDSCKRIREYAPQDEKLHAIADVLADVQRRNFYQLAARIQQSGYHSHEYTMSIQVVRASEACQDMTEDAESVIIEAMRDLASWLYRQLESEYEYLNSDESVDENIRINEYTFTEDGRRFG